MNILPTIFSLILCGCLWSRISCQLFNDKNDLDDNSANNVENEEHKNDSSLQNTEVESHQSAEHYFAKLKAIFDLSGKNSILAKEYLSYDGWYHNLDSANKGSKGSPLVQLTPNLATKPTDDLPNVFMISESLFAGESGPFSGSDKNLLFVHFGIFVLNEILDSRHLRCPPSYSKVNYPSYYLKDSEHKIPYVPASNHSYMLLNKLERHKSLGSGVNNPVRKINMRSVWIDGETIYGDSKFCSDQMRTFEGGKLFELPQPDSLTDSSMQCFNVFGSDSVNENPFTWTLRWVWLRWHNIIANIISLNYPTLSDEAIYQSARKLTIASLQQVVFNEWLPVMLRQPLPPFHKYSVLKNPQISDLFEASFPLYLHSLVSPFSVKLLSDCSKYSLLRTCNTYDRSMSYLLEDGTAQLLNGLLIQSAQRDDQFIAEDIRRFSKGQKDHSRQDWVAIFIEQNREFLWTDYLSVRAQLGFDSNTSFNSFEQISVSLWPFASKIDKALTQKLSTLYNEDVHKVDLAVGTLMESDGHGPGQLNTWLIRDQFLRIRDSDRMHFENTDNGIFNNEQIQQIKRIKFAEILKIVSNINEAFVQPNAFLLSKENSNTLPTQCEQLLKELLVPFSCDSISVKNSKQNCLTLDPTKSGKPLEQCTPGSVRDFFVGSEFSLILTLTFLVLWIAFLIALLRILVHLKHKQTEHVRLKASKLRRMTVSDKITLAQEWVDHNEPYRNVEVILNNKHKSIKVRLEVGDSRLLRCIYLNDVVDKVWVQCSHNQAQNHLLIRVPKEYDLVLKFDSYYEREKFLAKLEAFFTQVSVAQERSSMELNSIFKFAYTKAKRQRHLEQFFRVVFSHAFNKKTKENIDVKTAKEVIETELTQFEFAEALSMRPDSTFVKQMFSLIDKDNNGYISFREFLDVMVIFAKGTAEQKVKIMFDMYDVNQSGRLSINDFKAMIKSLLEIANQSISPIEMEQTIHSMLSEVGFHAKKELSFEEFNKLFSNYKEELGYSELNFDLSNLANLQAINKRETALFRANDTIIRAYSYFGDRSGPDFSTLGKQTPTFLKIETHEHAKEPDWLISWIRFVDARKNEMFFIVLYTLLVVIIFVDKAYYYTYLNESSGLRQVAGLGVTITRGSASVLMFTFSSILLTMCRNVITFLRETFLHQYIPFDGAVTFHKYIAAWAFAMSIIHAVGHLFNFYHVSTQRPSDLNCLFREIYFMDNESPKFSTWAFGTVTGLSGISLLMLLFVMYLFAIQYSRRHVFNAFWRTHNLYPLFYLLIVVHGLGKLIQPPIFYIYFLLPVTIFTFDRLISASRKRIEISVVKATLHPSNVTHLEFKKPHNFDYKSGQWMRIACLELNSNEYHPFTIASAPHEETLSLYIRAVGPFTKNLRQLYDSNALNGRAYPKAYLDGPYGEGHQDWLKFDVSVLVGGGIGITPFASIIKDITFRSSTNAKINCKKVYFLWVTRTQKTFEWMSDVIREAEAKDRNNLLVTHIFITQFYEKFDLRTTMLYICERHFQRISNKSLFTGLKAKTHFGRPNFEAFFDSLQLEHPKVERVGIFSCGPNPMTNSVQQACESLNRKEGAIFIHHFENF